MLPDHERPFLSTESSVNIHAGWYSCEPPLLVFKRRGLGLVLSLLPSDVYLNILENFTFWRDTPAFSLTKCMGLNICIWKQLSFLTKWCYIRWYRLEHHMIFTHRLPPVDLIVFIKYWQRVLVAVSLTNSMFKNTGLI